MEAKHIYLDDTALKHAEVIVNTGSVNSVSAAIRLALAQVARTIVQPTTP